jgi:hypothetical protein
MHQYEQISSNGFMMLFKMTWADLPEYVFDAYTSVRCMLSERMQISKQAPLFFVAPLVGTAHLPLAALLSSETGDPPEGPRVSAEVSAPSSP